MSESTGAVEATPSPLQFTTIPIADPPEAITLCETSARWEGSPASFATPRQPTVLRRGSTCRSSPTSGPRGRETTFVSPQIDRLVGYTDEWLADPALARLVHPDDRDEASAERDAVDAAKPVRLSYRMLARDVVSSGCGKRPSPCWTSRAAALHPGYLLDVGERKAAEDQAKELRTAEAVTAEEARDRQRKIEFVAEAASVLASSLDVSSTVGEGARCSRPAPLPSGASWTCSPKTAARPVRSGRWRHSVGGDRASPEPDPAVREVIQNRRPELSATHMCLPLASGGRRSLGALTLVAGERAAPYEGTDLPWGRAVAGMIALALDNSHLHAEVEARSDANKVLTHVGEGVSWSTGRASSASGTPASAAITGVSAEAAVGTPASDAIPDWHELSARVPPSTAGEPVRPSTLPLDTEHGERWISISGVEFISGTVYALRDITEEHRLDELKAESIATASHELRTPLAAVYGAAQTLRRHDFALDDAGARASSRSSSTSPTGWLPSSTRSCSPTSSRSGGSTWSRSRSTARTWSSGWSSRRRRMRLPHHIRRPGRGGDPAGRRGQGSRPAGAGQPGRERREVLAGRRHGSGRPGGRGQLGAVQRRRRGDGHPERRASGSSRSSTASIPT